MDFIKKYSAMILPVGIAIVAVIFIAVAFVLNGGVKESMAESLSLARKVSSQLSDTPSDRQADIEKSYQARHKADAEKIESLVQNSTSRELISYKIFPEPKDRSRQIFKDFGEEYRRAVQELVKKVGGSDAPSEKEIEATLASTGGARRVKSRDGIDPIVDALCRKRAQTTPVYANPDIFDWYKLWNDYKYIGQVDAIKDCWYSQVAYWIYSDVIDSISQLNGDSQSVFESPVKRLVGVTFTKMADNVLSNSAKSSELDTPAYVTEELPPILPAEAWTQRVGDDKIDVIHFSVSVILSSDQVPDFMKALCSEKTHTFRGWTGKESPKEYKHNQITILNSKITPVVLDDAQNLYYRYGGQSVVQWTSICEYVFIRDSYDKIKPSSIKNLIGQSDN